MDVNQAWDFFSARFQKEIDENIPKTTDSKLKKRKKIWMTRTAMGQYRLKYRAWREHRQSGGSPSAYYRSRNEAKKLRKMLRKLRRLRERCCQKCKD